MLVLAALVACITSCEKTPTQPSSPRLAFIAQPTPVTDGQPLQTIQVAIQDGGGNTVTRSATSVTLALGPNVESATISGTLTAPAVSGVATFSDLRIDRPGRSYTLIASAPGLLHTTSDTFSVTLAFATVSPGERHTCGITVQGQAYCWGSNAYGSLGYIPTGVDAALAPGAVAGGLRFRSVNAGFVHTCGLTTTGAAYCWGHNDAGEIGDGTTTDRSTPTAVAGGHVFASLSTNASDDTCGLTAAGAAYCWGANFNGKLGDGTTITRTSPVAVAGGLTFAMLSVGGYHTCGVTTAGAAYCWGYNFHGQLGDGTTADRWSPVAVHGGLTFRTVTVGSAHTCGLTTTGKAYCWGSNSSGQLGNEGLIDRTTPEAVVDGQFVSLSAGSDHTCGVTSDNTVSCWGHNGYGELGDGTRRNRWQPAAVQGLVQGKQVELSTGSFYTCAVTDGHTAFCWGSNIEGQLGDGTTTDRLTPARVVPPFAAGA